MSSKNETSTGRTWGVEKVSLTERDGLIGKKGKSDQLSKRGFQYIPDSENKTPWRPFPWNIIPDKVAFLFGLMILIPPAPFMGVSIGMAELSMFILKKILGASTLLQLIWGKCVEWVGVGSRLIGSFVLRDHRDSPYLIPVIFVTFYAPCIYSLLIYRYLESGFEWHIFFLYHLFRIGPRFRFFAYIHVLVHKEGHDHKGLFKSVFSFLNKWYIQWVLGPFYGQVPYSYRAGHNKIHHRYDNGPEDIHTNIDLDRTKLFSFIQYIPRFFLYWTGLSPIVSFWYRKEWKFLKWQASGTLFYFLIVVMSWVFLDWKFAVAYNLYPLYESTIFFSGISYMWHCFVEPTDPDNQYINSVTILNGRDNIYNEDFHVAHHTEPTLHWSDYEGHYYTNIHYFKKYQATIFQDTEEGEMLYWMLAGKWDIMAEHFVDLNDKLTTEEKKQLILMRLRYTVTKKANKQT